MYITIAKRGSTPKTEIFAKILKKNIQKEFCWDRDVMLLIHGGPGGNHTLYADLEDSLLELADLVIIDLRGCGFSKKIDSKHCTLEVHIDDIDAILKSINLTAPIIHGCSYGAIIALGYAIKYPDKISKLILSSCAASGNFIQDAKNNLEKFGNSEQIEAAKKLWNGAFESSEQFSEYYKIMASLYIYKENDAQSQIPTETSKNIPYNFELVNLAFQKLLPAFDFREQLNLVKTKTLIFSGQNDWIMDSIQADILHAGIKESTLVSLEHCGHFPWKDRLDDFIHHMRWFVETSFKSDTDDSKPILPHLEKAFETPC